MLCCFPSPPPRDVALLHRRARSLRLEWRLLVELAVLHDGEEPVLLLQDANIGERIAVDEKHVGEEARLDLAKLTAHAHDLAAIAGAGRDRFHWRHADHIDEI